MFISEEKVQRTWPAISKLGVPFNKVRSSTVYHLVCDGCNREFTRPKSASPVAKKTLHHFCSECDWRSLAGRVSKTRRVERCRQQVGVTRISDQGYPQRYVGPDYPYFRKRVRQGYYWIYEHEYVMHESLGRCLAAGEVVHHIDGDKTNNALENLVVLTVQEHNNCHARAEQVVFDLVRRGDVIFNTTTKMYEIAGDGESFNI